MKKTELKRFRANLEEKRDAVIRRARETMDQDMTLDASELPDEMDLASSEYMQSFTFRLRGRERVFLQKIEKALKKLDEGAFGVCEDCEEPISSQAPRSAPRNRALHPLQGGRGADGARLRVVPALLIVQLDPAFDAVDHPPDQEHDDRHRDGKADLLVHVKA